MNKKTTFLAIVLAVFTADTAYVVYQYGVVGFFELALANPATQIVGFDLVLALTMIAVWMIRDARERGLSAAPYVVLTAVAGSAGPLLYLIRREWSGATAPQHYGAGIGQTAAR